MKKKHILISLGIVVLLLLIAAASFWGYCSVYGTPYSRISFRLTMNDKVIMECDDGYVTELSPKNGGYRLHDAAGGSLYITYGTGRGKPVDGTIIDITAQNSRSQKEHVFSFLKEKKAGEKTTSQNSFRRHKKRKIYHEFSQT